MNRLTLTGCRQCLVANRRRFNGGGISAAKSNPRRTQRDRSVDDNLAELEAVLDELSSELDIDQQVSLSQQQPSVIEEPADAAASTAADDRTNPKNNNKSPFTIQRFKTKTSPSFFSRLSFGDVQLSAELQEALASIDISRPSQIQALALGAYLESASSQTILLADQAGSGKTLAYLLPTVQKLREDEKNSGKRMTIPNQPRAVIITPTAELAAQVLELCRSISKFCPFRCVALTGGRRPWATQVALLDEGVDIAVCTPKRLLSHLQEGTMKLDQCRTMVIDEVDILLGEFSDFRDDMKQMLEFVLKDTQFLLATATLPDHTYGFLLETFTEMTVVMGPGLHCTAPGVIEQLVDCSGGDVVSEESGQERKLAALAHLIRSETEQTPKRTVIFCNKIDTCRRVENYLKRRDRHESEFIVLPYHAAIDTEKLKSNLQKFLQQKEQQHVVLIATDRASRGLDTYAVSHVILFDFPRDPSEYVRRVGRTARGASGEGLVSVLALGRQVQQARIVLSKSKKGMPIHSLPETDL